MPVARMRKDKIISRRISQHQSSEKPRPADVLPYRPSCTPNGKHRPRQEKRIAKVPGSGTIAGLGYAIPVVEESLQADHREAPRVLANPGKGQPLAFSRVGQFAHALELLKFKLVKIRLKVSHQHSLGTLPIAQRELKSEIVSQKNKFPEDFIVPDEPRGYHEKKDGRRQHHPG